MQALMLMPLMKWAIPRLASQQIQVISRACSYCSTEVPCVDAVKVSGYDGLSSAPLALASSKGHVEIVQTLIGAGANVNEENTDGNTALHEASYFGHHKVVQMLIHAGADVNFCNAYGQSALWITSERGDHKTAQILIDAGADINSQDNTGILRCSIDSDELSCCLQRVALSRGLRQTCVGEKDFDDVVESYEASRKLWDTGRESRLWWSKIKSTAKLILDLFKIDPKKGLLY